MNGAHKKTLAAIFSKPAPLSITWSALVSLLLACGCDKQERAGSRVSFAHETTSLDLHKPHPQKELKPYQVRLAREFLEKIGKRP